MSGISGKITNSFDIREMGDIYKKFPIISILFACSAFALVGIPPLSGFWGKLMIAQAGLINHEVLAVVVLLLVSVFTLFSMTKIWTEAFLKKSPSTLNYSYEAKLINKHPLLLSGPLLMTLLILFISLFPNILYEFSEKASKQLRNPSGYIETVINHYKR
jgi:multicomponent Na+:H+ antiporter subunit D